MLKLVLTLVLLVFNALFPILSTYDLAAGELSEKVHAGDGLIEMITQHPHNVAQEMPGGELLSLAIKGYIQLQQQGKLPIGKPLSVIDFSLPSNQKRLWVIDMQEGRLLHHGWVAHGRNSGSLMAERFSNVESSYMSSLGFYLTAETYQGKHGYSLRLDGLEKGFNDRARDRAIVIHGADYARESFIKQTGRLGRSLGCPALPREVAREVIDLMKDGSLLFVFGDDPNYLGESDLLNS